MSKHQSLEPIFPFIQEFKPAHDKRPRLPNHPWAGIIIHHTTIGNRNPYDVSDGLWSKLFQNITDWLVRKDENYVSAHFIIGYKGEIVQLVDPDTHQAFHAGVSEFFHPLVRRKTKSWNQYAIGVELIGDGNRGPFSKEQYISLGSLCRDLIKRYPTIDPRCITGHENIAPGRKIDPGRNFNWHELFSEIYR